MKIYLRVAKTDRPGKFKVAAAAKPNHKPLTKADMTVLPTAAFAIEVDIPEAAFQLPERVIGELALTEDDCRSAATLRVTDDR